MAIQFTDFSDPNKWAQNKQEGIANFLPNILKGYQAAKAPEEFENEQALKKAQTRKALSDAMGGGLTGALGNALKLQQLKQSGNLSAQDLAQLEQMQEQAQEHERATINYQNAVTETLPKSRATSLGKMQMELDEINNGYQIGTSNTGKPIKLDPQKRDIQLATWETAMSRELTDQPQRDRMIRSAAVHNILSNINPDIAFSRSGLWGKLQSNSEKGLSSIANLDSENKLQFDEQMANLDLFAQELRNYWKDSITNTAQEHLRTITNPNSWLKSPESAKRSFNTVRKRFEEESQILRNSTLDSKTFGYQYPDNNKTAKDQEEQLENQMKGAIKTSPKNPKSENILLNALSGQGNNQQPTQQGAIDVDAVLKAAREIRQ